MMNLEIIKISLFRFTIIGKGKTYDLPELDLLKMNASNVANVLFKRSIQTDYYLKFKTLKSFFKNISIVTIDITFSSNVENIEFVVFTLL